MGKKIPDEVINQIPILYKELGVKSKVAEKLGISVASVSKYLTIFDAAPAAQPTQESITSSTKKRVLITPELEQEINERYLACANMSQVARDMGITPATVKAHLSEENLKIVSNECNDRDALFFYIYRLFGEQSEDQPVTKWNIVQMQKFRKQGMPYRGQLLTLKYFYEVKHGDKRKAKGSIGIIPFVYEEARLYYEKQAKKAEEITNLIQQQLEKDRIEIKFNPADYMGQKKRNKNKKLIDLSTLGD